MKVNKICILEHDILGPGRRIGIWFQGCSLGCKGCIVPELWKDEGTTFTPEELFTAISPYKVEGVTLSGGEPFQQSREELLKFLKLLRDNRLGTWVYTGYTLQELLEKDFYRHIALIDVLVEGRYIEELDDGKPWRGSSNQRILLFSNRYTNAIVPEKRTLQIEITDSNILVLGIPPKGFLKELKNSLGSVGISVRL